MDESLEGEREKSGEFQKALPGLEVAFIQEKTKKCGWVF